MTRAETAVRDRDRHDRGRCTPSVRAAIAAAARPVWHQRGNLSATGGGGPDLAARAREAAASPEHGRVDPPPAGGDGTGGVVDAGFTTDSGRSCDALADVA